MAKDQHIELFFHCRQCMEDKPLGKSMEEFSHLAVGLTSDKQIAVRCIRHDALVGVLTEHGRLLEKLGHCECERCNPDPDRVRLP
jgi:hypothetical protein